MCDKGLDKQTIASAVAVLCCAALCCAVPQTEHEQLKEQLAKAGQDLEAANAKARKLNEIGIKFRNGETAAKNEVAALKQQLAEAERQHEQQQAEQKQQREALEAKVAELQQTVQSLEAAAAAAAPAAAADVQRLRNAGLNWKRRAEAADAVSIPNVVAAMRDGEVLQK